MIFDLDAVKRCVKTLKCIKWPKSTICVAHGLPLANYYEPFATDLFEPWAMFTSIKQMFMGFFSTSNQSVTHTEVPWQLWFWDMKYLTTWRAVCFRLCGHGCPTFMGPVITNVTQSLSPFSFSEKQQRFRQSASVSLPLWFEPLFFHMT